MNLTSESAMIDFGRQFASKIKLPAVFELIGDVGTGKTTFTRGLAAGLGVSEPVTSPSFTISKRYAFPLPTPAISQPASTVSQPTPSSSLSGELVHYDFYRLDDPGLMRDELEETLSNPHSVVVVEWGGDIVDLLPSTKYSLHLELQADGSRNIIMNEHAKHAWEQTK